MRAAFTLKLVDGYLFRLPYTVFTGTVDEITLLDGGMSRSQFIITGRISHVNARSRLGTFQQELCTILNINIPCRPGRRNKGTACR